MQGIFPLHPPVGDSRLLSAATDFHDKNSKFSYTLRLFPQIDIEPPRNRLPCVISGHTIFEVSAHNQTPTSLNANAMKTRMKRFVPLLLASFCLLLASIRVHTLLVLNQRVPDSSGSTNCHGRTRFLPCWLCNCGPLSQPCPSRQSFVQCNRFRSLPF